MALKKDYLYTNGVIAAISKNLVNKDYLNKIIDANSEEAILLFNNTSYISSKKINSIYDVSRILDIEKYGLNRFLKNECPNQIFIDYVNTYNDYQNLEQFLKNYLFGFSFDEKFVYEGNFSVAKIKEAFLKNDFTIFDNEHIKNLFNEVNKIKSKEKNFAKIDHLFKKYMFKNLQIIVKNDKILQKILKYRVDLQNLILAIRVKNIEEFQNQFILNGNLDEKIFKKYILENIFNSSVNDKIFDCWSKILKREESEDKLKLLEKENKILELRVLNCFEDKIESMIPFLKYYYRKTIEIYNLRMIFSLKMNNLDSYIKEKLLEEN